VLRLACAGAAVGAAGAAVGAAVVVLVAASTPAYAEIRTGGLSAGAARVGIAVPDGTPLAGYGAFARRLGFPDVLGRYAHAFWFRPHEGRESPIAARALVFGHGATRVAWITVDLVAVDRRLTAEVTARLERAVGTPVTVIISASHTHSGPGGFGDSEIMGFVALDRPDATVRDVIVRALVDAARAADARRVPARVGLAAQPGPDVTRGRLGSPVDREIVVVKVGGPGGRPIAVVWSFAIHPTMLGPRNRELSDDVTGAATRALEATFGVPVLFVNGAVGDVSPRGHGRSAIRDVGGALARAVQATAGRAELREVGAPAVATARIEVGRPSLSLRNCLGRWLPGALGVPLGAVYPSDATLTAVALGDAAWVTVPGELQSSLGLRIKRAVRDRWPHAIVAGLSNDYLGYFVERAAYDQRTYVTCATLYGADTGERLAETAATLLRGLGSGR
jgi:hypothetical protein